MNPAERIALSRSFFQAMCEPLFLCTVMANDRPNGCVVTQVMQLSYSDTPLMGVALGKENLTCSMVCETKRFGLSYLEMRQTKIAERFGLHSGREVNKFAEIAWQEREGIPLVTDVPGWALFRVCHQIDVETHLLFIAALESASSPTLPVLDRDMLLRISPDVANRLDPWDWLPDALHRGTLHVWC